MDCATKNVTYITCTRHGVEYVEESGQKLNNNKTLSALYLYQHFNSDRHMHNAN